MKVDGNTMNVPFVDLKSQHLSIANEVDEAISSVMQRTAFILGPEVSRFEKAFAKYCEADFAIGVGSGTAALELALRAFDIGPGDEVITAANTFIATALAISSVGATPVLVDVDAQNYLINVNEIEKAVTKKTKAIIPVHLYGQPVDMDLVLEVASAHNLIVIEDACQAHGAKFNGKRVGGLGHAAAFSFYPAKNLGAYGDAGMVVTNNPKAADMVRVFRDVGQSKKYHHPIKGYNHRLDNLQAAILEVKLDKLDEWNASRRQAAVLYNQLLDGSQVEIPIEAPGREHVYHLYVIQTNHRDELQALLKESGVSTGIHYPIPIHLQPAYDELGFGQGDFPITEKISGRILSLPMYPGIPKESILHTAETIINSFKKIS